MNSVLKKAVGVFVVVVLAGVTAWAIAAQVESPAQAAARSKPPVLSPVVAPLDQGYLQGPVSLTVAAQWERTASVTWPDAASAVVTSVEIPAGQQLPAGGVLARADGLPIFVLPGSFPFYRDLDGGESGDDVTQLQNGLESAGYLLGKDRRGMFGAGTKIALSKMYKSAGYTAPDNDGALHQQIAALDAELAGATPRPEAATEKAALIARLGARALSSQLVTTSELPAVVQTVAPVGGQLSGGAVLATLGAGQQVLSASVPTEAIKAVVVGATGTFTDAAGAPGTVTVSTIGPGASPTESTVTMTATGGVQAGANYVVQIENPAAESGKNILAPLSAIVTRGNRSYVYRKDGAVFVQSEVKVIGSVGGVAAIETVGDAASLTPGATEVRLGRP